MSDSRIRLIVFDCDGTLVDSQNIILASMELTFEKLGLPLPEFDAVREVIGLSLVDAIGRLLPHTDERKRVEMAEMYRDAFAHLQKDPLATEALFPHAREVLEQLHAQGYLLGIATGKSRRGLRGVLKRHDLDSFFSSLQTADDAPSKPHPGMILHCMEETGSEPHETMMIGDTTFDILAGVNAGARSVGVRWGYHASSALEEAGAETVLDDFTDLPLHLENPPPTS